MPDVETMQRNSIALQKEMFRLAETECGLSIAVLSRTRGIAVSTLKGWREGSAMPAWALGALRLPDDLASLVLSPFGKHVGTDEDGDGGDLHELVNETAGFTADYIERARDGVICHQDKAALGKRARKIVPMARKAAA